MNEVAIAIEAALSRLASARRETRRTFSPFTTRRTLMGRAARARRDIAAAERTLRIIADHLQTPADPEQNPVTHLARAAEALQELARRSRESNLGF